MAGLEEMGIPGPDHLREALTNCTDPLSAIEEFQIQNGILLPSLRPALPFLDLHNVRRLDFHQSVMDELRERLLQRISEVAESNDKGRFKILNDLLNKCFPVVKVPALRPVVLCIMKHLPKIKHEYLMVVMDNKMLYKEADVEVKQQIWQDNQALFGDEVSPFFGKYIEDKEELLFNHENRDQVFFSILPKTRRQDEVVQQLAKMIGNNIKLYDMVLQFLRTLYLRTRNVHYCTLRVELLMVLHDNDVNDIVTIDPCHKFTWCLDACIRERFVDVKRARELQVFLDSIHRSHDQVLGDLSMILCDPHAINTLALSTMKALQMTLAGEGLPRNNDELLLLLRMISLGQGAWNMIDSQYFKEPKMDASLVTRFLPCLLSLMVDDQMNLLTIRKSEDDSKKVEPLPEYLVSACRDNSVATTILFQYVCLLAENKDHVALCRVMPVLSSCDVDIIYDDMSLHSLVSHLAGLSDGFSQKELCEAVFDNFFLPYISRENVLRHLLRLLWWVYRDVIPVILDKIMETIKPNNQHSEAVRKLYKALVERRESYQPSPVAEPEQMDSPFVSMPSATPVSS